MKSDLSVEMFGVTFTNPVMGASGTVGYGIELAQYIDLNKIGAVVTKGTLHRAEAGQRPPAPV